MPSETSRVKSVICDFFANIPQVLAVVLFGSYARGAASDQSDIDIAILCDRPHLPDALTLFAWRDELNARLCKEIDLVCLNTASPIIGMQVYKYGEKLLLKDELEFANYQMRLFSDYAELKEFRAPMEKDILKRKLYD